MPQHMDGACALRRAAAATLLLLTCAFPAASQEQLPKPVVEWFEALGAVDRIAFGELIAADAVIELRSLSFSQTKAEYIEALDNWEEFAADTEILTRPVSEREGGTTVQVCYRRPSEAWTNLEVFTFSDGFITGVVQERIADDCAGFE